MEEAVVEVRFPLGTLPCRGYRCPTCGREDVLGSDAGDLQELARRLGLFGPERRSRRKLMRTGGSIAVTLDPELLRSVLGHARAGAVVEVGLEGERIVIRKPGQARA